MKRGAMVLLMLLGMGFGLVSLAADFDGDSRDDVAIFRPSSGLWAVRGVTRVYFGTTGDTPAAGDYTGDGMAEIGVFRPSSGLWAVRGVSRIYFGGSTDTPIAGGGGGQRLYDYVVRPNDGANLVTALENNDYKSVFIPAGTYRVSEVINVTTDNKHIVGESNATIIEFVGSGDYLLVSGAVCHLENLRFKGGGNSTAFIGTVYLVGVYATVENCRSVDSLYSGFHYTIDAEYVSFINCVSRDAFYAGFQGDANNYSSRLVGCTADGCMYGIVACNNISSCVANSATSYGFYLCRSVSSAQAYECVTYGFHQCFFLSACRVKGNNITNTGFNDCDYVSSSYADGCTTAWNACYKVDTGSTNHPL